MPARILNIAGRVLLTLGVLVLLFVAYQLWGTGLLEAHSQAGLRAELEHELPGDVLTGPPGHPNPGSSAARGPNPPPAVAPATAAPGTGQPVGILQIPSIGLDQVVVEGVQAAQLRTGPGHYPGTPLPGQAGNVAIAGHRTTYARPFYELGSVAPGDPIVVTTPQGVFTYTTRSFSVVSPSDVSVLAPTAGDELTLTTCNPPYSAATRLVLRAVLTRSVLFTPPSRRGVGAPRSGGGRHREGPQWVPGRARQHSNGLAGSSTGGAWPAAVGWGLLVGAVTVGGRIVGRRARRRWTVYLPAALLLLVVLFAFFTAVTPLLPASL